jgi:hypothetical protein
MHFVGAVPCEVLAGLQALLWFAVGLEDEVAFENIACFDAGVAVSTGACALCDCGHHR